MSHATARLEFRATPEDKALIEEAARLEGEPVTAFARTAARSRAESVVRRHRATTVVPEAFFDELMAALDDEPRSNAVVVDAMQQLPLNVERD